MKHFEYPDDIGKIDRTIIVKGENVQKNSASAGALFDGQYELLKCLDNGGMGHVFVAEDKNETKKWRKVAIKVLRPEVGPDGQSAWDEGLKERLKREADIARDVRHDNVINVRRHGELKGRFEWNDGDKRFVFPVGMPFVVMDYIADAVSLETYLKEQGGRLSEFDLKNLLAPIARALDHAHQGGAGVECIVHRDVKPSNILIQQRAGKPYPWLLDFGISKPASSPDVPYEVTMSDRYKTPSYAAPERLAEEDACVPTPAEDIFSFAVILYECLMGHHPFREDGEKTTQIKLYSRIRERKFERIPGKFGMADAITHGLSPEPGERPKTCLEFFDSAGDRSMDGLNTASVGFCGFSFALECTELTWNGKKQCPKVRVSGEGTISEGDDYFVKYENNAEVGEATAVVVWLKRSSRKLLPTEELRYRIVARPLDRVSVGEIPDCAYSGQLITPELSLVDPELDINLKPERDFMVEPLGDGSAGEAKIRIKGIGHYTGEIIRSFNITARAISQTECAPVAPLEFNGKSCRPDIVLHDAEIGRDLVKDVDYVLEYGTDVIGESWVLIAGRGNYEGSVTETFTILPRDISKATIAPIDDVRFDGTAITKIAVRLSDASVGRDLKEGVDYSVRLENADRPGLASARVSGAGHYGGQTVCKFKILKGVFDVPHGRLSQQFEYDGREHSFEVPVSRAPNGMWVEFALSANGPFSPDPITQKDVCEAKQIWFRLQCEGYETYVGIGSYKVEPRSVRSLRIDFPEKGKIYLGNRIPPNPVVYDTKLKLKLISGRDFDLTNLSANRVGKGSVDVVGRGNYCDVRKCEIDVESSPLEEANVDAVQDCVYDAKCQKPKIILRVAGRDAALIEGDDYRVVYGENVNAGEGNVTIIGRGDFSGEQYVKFRILPKDIANVVIAPLGPINFTGRKTASPAINAKDAELGVALKQGSDYDVELPTIDRAGVVSIQVRGKGNYCGIATVTLNVLPRPLPDNATVSEIDPVTFDGRTVLPQVRVLDTGLNLLLEQSVDYTLAYKDNKSPGTASVNIEGCGNYCGTITQKFLIKEKKAEFRRLTPSCLRFLHSAVFGTHKRPSVVVSDPVTGAVLQPGVDYSIQVDFGQPLPGWGRIRIEGDSCSVYNALTVEERTQMYDGVVGSRFMIADARFDRLVSALEGFPISVSQEGDLVYVVRLEQDCHGKGLALLDSLGEVTLDLNGHVFDSGDDPAVRLLHDPNASCLECGMRTANGDCATLLRIIDSASNASSGILCRNERPFCRGTGITALASIETDGQVKVNGGAYG